MDNLKEAMRREDISMEDISRVLGTHRNTVSNKVNGETDFTIPEALTLWRIFFKRYSFFWIFDEPKQDSA